LGIILFAVFIEIPNLTNAHAWYKLSGIIFYPFPAWQ
jgi:hypothetical protein